MKVRVWTSPQADEQAIEAATWWRVNRPASPGLFRAELARGLQLLAEAPDVGRRYPHPDIPGLRRLLLSDTRYHVYYVHEADRGEVVVLAIRSAVRGRGPRLVRRNTI